MPSSSLSPIMAKRSTLPNDSFMKNGAFVKAWCALQGARRRSWAECAFANSVQDSAWLPILRATLRLFTPQGRDLPAARNYRRHRADPARVPRYRAIPLAFERAIACVVASFAGSIARCLLAPNEFVSPRLIFPLSRTSNGTVDEVSTAKAISKFLRHRSRVRRRMLYPAQDDSSRPCLQGTGRVHFKTLARSLPRRARCSPICLLRYRHSATVSCCWIDRVQSLPKGSDSGTRCACTLPESDDAVAQSRSNARHAEQCASIFRITYVDLAAAPVRPTRRRQAVHGQRRFQLSR